MLYYIVLCVNHRATALYKNITLNYNISYIILIVMVSFLFCFYSGVLKASKLAEGFRDHEYKIYIMIIA